MHNRIYQVSELPVPTSDYIDLSDFYEHPFCNEIADSVDNISDRDAELQMFHKSYSKRGISAAEDSQSFQIAPSGKTVYFENTYPAFVAAAAELCKTTKKDFHYHQGKLSALIYTLKSSFSDRFADYIAIRDEDEFDVFRLITMDEFMREAETGKTYHFGAIIDYHW